MKRSVTLALGAVLVLMLSLGLSGSIAGAAEAGPRIDTVSFSGPLSNPTVTLIGAGFGTQPAATYTTAGGGSDFGTLLHFSRTGPGWFWDAGYDASPAPLDEDNLGLKLLSYTDTQVRYGFDFGGISPSAMLAEGSTFAAYVRDARCSGTVDFSGVAIQCRPAATITLSPGDTAAVVGNTVTETATVTDAQGLPVVDGTAVTFAVTGVNAQPAVVVTTTNGQATFSYEGTLTGSDTLTASAGDASGQASITWQPPASAYLAFILAKTPPGQSPYASIRVASIHGRASGSVRFEDANVSLESDQITSVTTQLFGPAAIYGIATVDGEQVTFRVDLSGGFFNSTLRLRMSNGFDSGPVRDAASLTL